MLFLFSCVFNRYCDREFDEEKVLLQHQKAKHFKCSICYRKFCSAPSMVIHVAQVHKEHVSRYFFASIFLKKRFILYRVPNAMSGRDNVTLEIFGIQGVPLEDLVKHYEEVGANVSKALQKVQNVNSNYAAGPGMLTRAPLMSALTGSSTSLKSASSSDALALSKTCGSATTSSPTLQTSPPIAPSTEASSEMASVAGSEKSLSTKPEDTRPSAVSPGELASVVKITSFGCPKSTSKNSVLIYSDSRSIEERRIAQIQAK